MADVRFYFAWAPDGDTAFADGDAREDEKILTFEVSQKEGEAAALTVEIQNPKVGLLSADREQWAFLSWQPPSGPVAVLFHGRLVGVPKDVGGETVELEFIGRPVDFLAQKAALADSLRVLPFYDPAFVDPDKLEDPDTVLEGYSALWHIDRVTGVISISDILVPEDGTATIGTNKATYDSLQVSYGQEPLRRLDVSAEVNWTQTALGTVDLRPSLLAAFALAGGRFVSSYTGEGLQADWPLPGDDFGGGWSVKASVLTLLSGDGITPTFIDVPVVPVDAPGDPADNPMSTARFYEWTFNPAAFTVQYSAARARKEILIFSVSADVQSLLTEDDDPRTDTLDLSSTAIASPVDPGDSAEADGVMPIGDLRRSTYFGLDRGKDSVRYLLALARARLLISARAVEVSVEIPFEDAVGLTCRKGAIIEDDRIPGGEAGGKVIAYSFSVNGDQGQLVGNVTIGCAIGQGNALPALEDGVPEYVEAGYVERGYQLYNGGDVAGIDNELSFEDFAVVPVDDGVDFFHMTPARIVEDFTVTDGVTAQAPVLGAAVYPSIDAAIAALNAVKTVAALTLRPVTGGPFETDIAVTASALMVPEQIALGASA